VIGGQPLIKPMLFELARWIAEYYCCSLEAAMSCLLPQVVRQAQVSARMRNFARALKPVSDEELEKLDRRAPRQADALRAVRDAAGPRSVPNWLMRRACRNPSSALCSGRGGFPLSPRKWRAILMRGNHFWQRPIWS